MLLIYKNVISKILNIDSWGLFWMQPNMYLALLLFLSLFLAFS